MKRILILTALCSSVFTTNIVRADHAILLNCVSITVDPVSEIMVSSWRRNLWIAKNGSWVKWNEVIFPRTGKTQVGTGEAWDFADPLGKDARSFRFVPEVLSFYFNYKGDVSASYTCNRTDNPFVEHPRR